MAKDTEQKKPNLFLRILILAMTAALMLGALFLVVNRDTCNLNTLKAWLSRRSLSADETGIGAAFSYSGGSKQSVTLLDDGILFASDAGARYYSLSGQLYNEEITPLENPVLTSAHKTGVVYDAGGEQLYLYRNGQKAFSLSLPDGGDLLSARCNDSGWLAVTAQTSGYKGAVTVYDDVGAKVIEISLSSTFAVDAAVSPDKKTVAVVTMGQVESSFESQLLLYPTDSDQPSATVSLGSSAVLDLEYEQNYIWVLTDDSLHILSADVSSHGVYSFGRSYLKGCRLGGDGFALLLLGHYRAGAATQAAVVGPDGSLLADLELRDQILAYDAAGSRFALLTGDELTLYSPDGQVLSALNDPQGAKYMALSSDGFALLANQQEAWFYLPN